MSDYLITYKTTAHNLKPKTQWRRPVFKTCIQQPVKAIFEVQFMY